MRWFGESWGAPVNEECEQGPTPVGEQCLECEREIGEKDQGVLIPYLDVEAAYHHLCFLRAILPEDLFAQVKLQDRHRKLSSKPDISG